MMPEMQVSDREALWQENNELHQRIREYKYRIKKMKGVLDRLREFSNRIATYGHTDVMVAKAYEIINNELKAILEQVKD